MTRPAKDHFRGELRAMSIRDVLVYRLTFILKTCSASRRMFLAKGLKPSPRNASRNISHAASAAHHNRSSSMPGIVAPLKMKRLKLGGQCF